MAAQEAIHGLHNPPYAKNEPSNNGYDYNYAINDGSYGNHHYNPYMHYGEPQHSYEHHLPPHHHYPPHPNGPGQESHHHNLHYAQPPIPSNVNHHQHLHHYGHTMDGGMSLNPPSHYNMMPGSNHSGVYKEESAEDPYSFVDEETGANRSLPPVQAAGAADAIKSESNAAAPAPKKRGRKKKVVAEPGLDGEPPMTMDLLPLGVDSADGQPTKRKYTKSEHYKQRRRHDRFNGMTEEEVRSRTLPDHLASNLDVVIIGINPGLFAAYKGHHYAGPGNHFWKCLYLAGLVPEPMTADDDFKLVHFGIGFTNMVARATKGSADLTRKEIREGGRILLEKLQQYRPKIAVFNGKGIYEVFSGKKEFTFGKQPECIDGTNTFIWVMPSSSARCAQLPRAMDKVPFYSALKKFRDYLNGLIPEIDENEVIFNDPKIRAADDGTEISEHLKVDSLSSDDLPALVGGANELPTDERQQQPTMAANPISSMAPLENGTAGQIPVKKKRGRPKKIRIDGVIPVKQEQSSVPTQASSSSSSGTSAVGVNGELVNGQPPKKKRGRPKKIRTEEIRPAPPPLTDANGGCSTSNSNSSVPMENRGPPSASPSAPTYMGHPFGVATNQQQQHQPQPSSTIGHHPSNQQQQQQHPHVVDYYGRAPSTSGSGGPLSGLCNDMSPHPSSSSTPQPTTCSPRQMEFDTSVRDGSAISGQMNVGQPHAEHRMTPAENGDARHHQMTSPGIGKSQQEQQQQLAQPPRSHPGTPQPSMGYRPTPPAIGVPYHVPNQVKDVASKSLSGLESLVDQIPNMNDGGGNGGGGGGGGGVEPQHQHPNGMHVHSQPGAASATATTSAVPTSFGHHYPAPSQPSFSYPSTSFGHYAPHYTSPNGGSFPPNLYHTAGGQEFNRTGPAYPMTFAGATASQMNHRAPPHAMAGFPYSSYGQTYPPHPPPPNSAPAFSPYPAPSPASGFHPNTSYAYPSASGSTYAPSYTTQAGYLNANATLDRPKDDRTDPAFGGYQ